MDCKRQAESIPSGKPAFVPKQTWAQYPPHENLTRQDEISVPCWHCSTSVLPAPRAKRLLSPLPNLQPAEPLVLSLLLPLAQTSDFLRGLQALFSASKKAPDTPRPPRRPSAAVLPLWNWPQTQPHYGNPLYDAPGNS